MVIVHFGNRVRSIYPLFKTNDLTKVIWSNIDTQCSPPNNCELFVDWLEQIWSNKMW